MWNAPMASGSHADVPDPLTGESTSGNSYRLRVTAEQRLFLLAICWPHGPVEREPTRVRDRPAHKPPVREDLFAGPYRLRTGGGSYALGMLHQVGVSDGRSWLSTTRRAIWPTWSTTIALE